MSANPARAASDELAARLRLTAEGYPKAAAGWRVTIPAAFYLWTTARQTLHVSTSWRGPAVCGLPYPDLGIDLTGPRGIVSVLGMFESHAWSSSACPDCEGHAWDLHLIGMPS